MLLPRRFRAVLPFAAALIGCNPSPTHAPAASPYATPEPPPIPTGPSIVGRITLSSTKDPPRAGVVYLEDAPKQPGTLMTATINVDHKNFTPFIGVVTTGGTVTFGNLDALTHHVFSPDIKNFDTGFYERATRLPENSTSPAPWLSSATFTRRCSATSWSSPLRTTARSTSTARTRSGTFQRVRSRQPPGSRVCPPSLERWRWPTRM